MALTLTLDENNNQIKTRLGWSNKNLRNITEVYMIKKSREIEDYMKSHHPWQNRTGNAERALSAHVTSSKKSYVQSMELSHGVFYGEYLEYGMERRFAIIEPTIRLKGPEIINDLQNKIGMFVNVKEV